MRLVSKVASLALLLLVAAPALATDDWFVSFERIQVSPIQRSNTPSLVEVGTVDTDGFSELVFSLGGEFKEGVPSSGKIGVVLIPDIEIFQYLLRSEGQFVFPLEVVYEVGKINGAIFVSPAQTAKVAFPAYRVYMYNETTSGATVSLFVYRTR
jgi:hypothetical protein